MKVYKIFDGKIEGDRSVLVVQVKNGARIDSETSYNNVQDLSAKVVYEVAAAALQFF